jgi:hypothetical protein
MACLNITFAKDGNATITFSLEPSGSLNGFDYYSFIYYGVEYFMWHSAGSPGEWYIGTILDSVVGTVAELKNNDDECPTADIPTWICPLLDDLSTSCDCPEGVICSYEDRIFKEYKAIKLPKVCVDQDRGLEDCCCEYLVLANAGNESWKSDITSAWVKISDVTDGYSFELYKNGVLSTYQPTPNAFPNEPNAYYCTINWIDVLLSDGVGCYELKIGYNISGILGNYTWGVYNLLPYSIKNALHTARVRAEFSGYHEIEQINFTNSGIVTDLRFYGYIGNRQPNMEIDNIIYSNREMKRVIRENLNTYDIITDPSLKCIIQPLTDLILLSENNLYISDYNAHNHDYCLNDVPVIVSESPEIEYYEFSRKAKLTCQVEDKFKNKRTYY